MSTRNITYIQNNFYGNSSYGTSCYNYDRYAYGCNCGYSMPGFNYTGSCFGYGFSPRQSYYEPYHCYNHYNTCYQDREMPNGLKWALGIGVGASIIGMLTKAFNK